jgi:GNAT superfamily N-acetyltransferase
MEEKYQIVYEAHPEQTAWGIIGRGVHQYNLDQAGDDNGQRICYVLQGADDEIAGGIIAEAHWGWLYIDLMWVREDLRRCGYGSQLLAMVEDEAHSRGAKNAYLDTFSFQAPDFYKKHGYQVIGELTDFPVGHQRYYLMKEL